MAVTAADFIQPTGRVYESWFPGEDLPANLTLWLEQAAALTPDGATEAQGDAIALPYGYYRAFDAKFWALAGSPDTANLEGVGGRSIKDQRGWFSKEAAKYRAEFEVALGNAGVVETVSASGSFMPSESVPVTVVF